MKRILINKVNKEKTEYNLSLLFGKDYKQNTKEKRRRHKR